MSRAELASRKRLEVLFAALGLLALAIAVLTFLTLFVDMAVKGLPRLDLDFFTSFPSRRAALSPASRALPSTTPRGTGPGEDVLLVAPHGVGRPGLVIVRLGHRRRGMADTGARRTLPLTFVRRRALSTSSVACERGMPRCRRAPHPSARSCETSA